MTQPPLSIAARLSRTAMALAAPTMFAPRLPRPLARRLFAMQAAGLRRAARSQLRDVAVAWRPLGGRDTLWLTPAGLAGDGPAIFHIHGGGFCIGSPRTHQAMVGQWARAAGASAALPTYRLAPEHPFPAALDDVAAAYAAFVGPGGPPAERVILSGDSAGGALAAALLLRLKRQRRTPLPRAVVLFSPLLDLRLQARSWTTNARTDRLLNRAWAEQVVTWYALDADRGNPELSPLLGDLTGLPPLQILVGSDECLLGDAEAFAERARAAGLAVDLVVGPSMQHVWPFFAPIVPEAGRGIATAAAFVRRFAATSP